MKLEDCSKDELIHYIKTECFCSTRNLKFTVLMYRLNNVIACESKEAENSNLALKEYIAIMRPYDGKPIKDIPDEIIHKATSAMEKYEVHQKKWSSALKKYTQISRQIDKCTEEKGA